MKKLMFAAAALAAGVALADVTSANIVGYQNIESAESGYWQRGATFNLVGTDADDYDIQSLVPVIPEGAWDEEADDWSGGPMVLQDFAFMIQLLKSASGATEKTLYYLVGGAGSAGETAGWYERNDQLEYVKVSKKFKRGEGFLLSTPYVVDEGGNELSTTFITSGEVKLAAKTVTCPESGYWQRANYRPVALDIQKIVPSIPEDAWDEEADDWAGGPMVLQDFAFMIQLLKSASGATEKTLYYLVGGAGSAGETAGWYERNASLEYIKVTKSFDPGEGFLLSSPYVVDMDGNVLETYITFED